MKAQMEAQIEQLNTSYQVLESLFPSLPASFNYQGKVVESVALKKAFIEVISLITSVNNADDIDSIMSAIHQPNIVNISANILATVQSIPSNPEAYFGQLLNYIWSLKSSVLWMLPSSSTTNYEELIKNSGIESKFTVIDDLEGRLIETYDKFSRTTLEADAASKNVNAAIELIKGYEREAANAKTNAEASATESLTNLTESAKTKKIIFELLERLELADERQAELQKNIDDLTEKAKLVLEGNSKARLAGSFQKRRESLEKSQTIWFRSFYIGIMMLISGVFLTSSGFVQFPPLIKDGAIDIWGVIARALLTGPVIWFTWFAARQYGQTKKIIEDYAFKEASALAFIGYKREMEEDAEMIKKLRELAIDNFGTSPTRLFSGKEPSSPLHDILDKAFEDKGVFDKLIEMIKALKPNQ